MKIGIFSDPHLGFAEKGERAQEAFDNLSQAIDLCINEKVDFVILAGDIFDEPAPNHNILFNAMQCFAKAKKGESNVSLTLEKNNSQKKLSYFGLPILTIHGNHEYRGKETKTALDVLNFSELLIYFHASKIIVEKDNEKVCVHGLGAVPEKKAQEVLKYWNPLPEKDAVNILVLHQSFKEFMAVDDEMVATLSLADLPKDFELIFDGHLHWSNIQKLGETNFLLTGSTIATSIKKLESEKPKGVHFFDSSSKQISFKELPNQRKMFYHKISFKDANVEQVIDECKKIISSDLTSNTTLKPLIRLNLKGFLKKGLSSGDVDLKDFFNEFEKKAILSVSKNFSSTSFRKKISELREVQKERLSVVSLGFDLLEKNLSEAKFEESFSIKKLFDFLAEKDIDSALELVTKD